MPSKDMCTLWLSDLEEDCTNSDSSLTLLNLKVIGQRVIISTVIWQIIILLLSMSTVNEKVYCKWKSKVKKNWGLDGKESCSCFRNENDYLVSLYMYFSSISVAQSCPTLCDPINHSMPGLPVHHHFREFTQTVVHRVGDAIQPSHLLSSPSPLAPNPSQHQSLFQWVNSSNEVAKVLEFQL